MSITVVGTVFVDVKGYPYENFIPKGRNAGYMLNVHGGVGRNVAEDLGHLGLSPKLVALTDKSALAKEVSERLVSGGVDTAFVRQTDSGMGTWMAIFDDKGDVAASISVRPDLLPLADLMDEKHEAIFKDTDSIILEIDIEEEAAERVFKYARMYDKKVYALISVMSIALERRKFFPECECFICNAQEAGMLFGKELSAPGTPELEKQVLKGAGDAGFKKLIVTLGEMGSVYANAETGLTGYCPCEKVDMVDSTGAGDAFCAGASAALTFGRSLEEACRAGSLVAASVIKSTENVCPQMDIGF